ncbi:putative MFS-type transporter (plasmid) [Cupriavidus necator H850]|uniref:MFS transporter n=1 Tax=Cupriavidus necator TaxID=106590 RepID=UPI00129E36F8|nr:MFS transporter [Cupriavidus necator]KAI3605383.1 putative MFS-type transporter [Cupriavidus necator H850]
MRSMEGGAEVTVKPWKLILAATIGNALEWYDFIVYGFLAATLSGLFFPESDSKVALLMATLSIGIGFVARPLGAIVLGVYADRVGRKPAMTLVILLMFISTAMIAFAPTYAQLGIWATVLIACARLLQGFSAGGEFGSATSYLIEFAPAHRKGFYGSWQMFAQASGALLSTLVGALLFKFYTQEQVDSWAWRIPFLIGLLIGPVGLYIRRHLDEPTEFASAAHESVAFSVLWRSYWPQLLAGTAVSAAINVMSYVIVTYLPLYAKQSLGMREGDAFLVLLAAVALRMALIPVFGLLSDRLGRRAILASALMLFSATIYPGYSFVIAHPTVGSLLTVECWFALLIAAAYAPCPTYLSELFPVRVRATGLSIAYNIAATVFGGFSIFIVTFIHQRTGSQLAPAHYAVSFFVLALVAVFFVGASARGAEPTLPELQGEVS